MLNLTWQTFRLGLFATALGSTLVVLAKLGTTPKVATNSTQKPVNTLQTTVPLQGWQFLASHESTVSFKKETSENTKPESKFGRHYQYRQKENSLDVDLQYMTSDGNVSRYLFVYSPIHAANANIQIKYQPESGHYGLVSHQGKAYLTACITPRGSSTVTEQQFTQNSYAYDLQPGRILPWLLGQESLIDRRCLWTLMSTPLKTSAQSGVDTSAAAAAYKTLETAWLDWQRWWQANYPPS